MKHFSTMSGHGLKWNLKGSLGRNAGKIAVGIVLFFIIWFSLTTTFIPQHIVSTYGTSNKDPVTPIWYDYGPDIPVGTTTTPPPNWKCQAGSNFSEQQGNPSVFNIASSANVPPQSCVDQDPIDLSSANGRVLEIDQQLELTTFGTAQNQVNEQIGGFYLTTNSTPFNAYPTCVGASNLGCVKNINLIVIMFEQSTGCPGACVLTSSFITYILQPNNAGNQTFGQQDAGCTQGSVFFCTFPSAHGAVINSITTQLNYTGSSTTQSSSIQTIWIQPGVNIGSQTRVTYPKLDLAQKYYFGIFTNNVNFAGGAYTLTYFLSNNPPTSATSSYTNSMTIGLYAPPQAPCVVNPAICQTDTGGFFGELLHGLIAIAVWMIGAIIGATAYLLGLIPIMGIGTFFLSVFSVMFQIFRNVLNAIGTALTIGPLGDYLFSNLVPTLNTFFGQIPNIAADFTAFVNLFVKLITFNQFYVNWISILITLVNLLISLETVITTVIGVLKIGIPFMLLLDIVWLLFELVDGGTEALDQWWKVNDLVIVNFGKLVWFMIKNITDFIYQIITVGEIGIDDINPEIAGTKL